MKLSTTVWATGLILLALDPALHADEAKKPATKADASKPATPKATGPKAEMVSPDEIQWGDAPPDVPKGAKLGVLHGNPMKPGMYTIRLKLPEGYVIPPHWHSKDEQLTILSGSFILHMGDTMESEPHTLDAGAYHFLPAKMHHAAEAKGETIVQITGTGPFDIHYLNPADNPNPKTAKK